MDNDDQIRLLDELRAAVLTYTAMALCNSVNCSADGTPDPGDADMTIAALIHVARKGHELITAVRDPDHISYN